MAAFAAIPPHSLSLHTQYYVEGKPVFGSFNALHFFYDFAFSAVTEALALAATSNPVIESGDKVKTKILIGE